MTARSDASGHLQKAAEFLAAAEHGVAQEWHDAAVSAAVHAGINAKDAICLVRNGRTGKSDDHAVAASELKKIGGNVAQLVPTFERLLRLKSKAEYQSGPTSATDARHAVDWARRLTEQAGQIIRGG